MESHSRGIRYVLQRLVVCTATMIFTAGGAGAQCAGDCNDDGMVTVDEILTMVNISLGSQSVGACRAGDANGDGEVTVDEILTAVNNSLASCPAPPTATATRPPEPTATQPPVEPTATATEPPVEPTATATRTSTEAPPTATATAGNVPTPVGEGVRAAITSAAIAADGTVTAVFSLTDPDGRPLIPQTAATQDPNRARVRLTIAHLESYNAGGELNASFTRYVNDINRTRPAYDSGGTIETLDATRGIYRYTFRTKLPNHVHEASYSIGMQVDRTFGGRQRSANPIYDFVPAGGVAQVLAGSTTAQCNSCHDPLILHGNRREYRLCTLCHTEEGVDAKGTSIAMREMIHKIHRGKALPSIVNGPPGSKYSIFASFSQQDIVFAEKHQDGSVSGVGFPRAIQYCATCHSDGATASYHKDRASTGACTSCHDDVNPSNQQTEAGPPGTKHFQGRGFADGDCSFCHSAFEGKEFDVSVLGAHTVPARSTQLAGLNVDITGIRNHGAGQTPTISFKVTNNAGMPLTVLTGLNRVGFTISGPTTDYTTVLTLTAVGGGATGTLTGPDASGVFEYTLASPLPADATGTWVVGTEARRNVTLAAVDPIDPKTVQEAAPNQVVTFSVDGSAPLARRDVVADAKCGECHGEFSKDFSIHGNLRNTMEYCAVCHNSTQTDVARRRRDPAAVAAGEDIATIDFKVMIHKIHTGEELEQKPYTVYGFGPAPANYTKYDFAEVLYPGDRRNCQTCHLANTYLLPPYPGSALGTQLYHLDPATGNPIFDGVLPPISAACTSCHDSHSSMAHAETQTTADGREACLVCHAEGRNHPVSAVHAGRN